MDLKRGLISATLGVSVLASSAFGVDYSTMPTEELSKIRGAMQNATTEERNAFQQEWQKRIQDMTQEERQEYAGKTKNAGQGNMMQQRGSGMGGRMGSGFGGGSGGRR